MAIMDTQAHQRCVFVYKHRYDDDAVGDDDDDDDDDDDESECVRVCVLVSLTLGIGISISTLLSGGVETKILKRKPLKAHCYGWQVLQVSPLPSLSVLPQQGSWGGELKGRGWCCGAGLRSITVVPEPPQPPLSQCERVCACVYVYISEIPIRPPCG